MRAKLKAAGLSQGDRDNLLNQLYQIAVVAELLHDKSESERRITLNELKRLNLESLSELEISYKDIGYAQLRLIRKSDVKLMLAQWGRPRQHLLPRQFFAQWWSGFIAPLKASN